MEVLDLEKAIQTLQNFGIDTGKYLTGTNHKSVVNKEKLKGIESQ